MSGSTRDTSIFCCDFMCDFATILLKSSLCLTCRNLSFSFDFSFILQKKVFFNLFVKSQLVAIHFEHGRNVCRLLQRICNEIALKLPNV